MNGQAVPFGTPITRAFSDKEYEFYVQDSYKIRKDLTLTYGLRYSLYKPPYELNGVEVVPQTPLSQFFAARVGGQAAGIPSFALPNALISITWAARQQWTRLLSLPTKTISRRASASHGLPISMESAENYLAKAA